MSQITTHVLDTAIGKPAQGVPIALSALGKDGDWVKIAEGITNSDGRISDLLKDGMTLNPGIYRMLFKTQTYFEQNKTVGFYPEVPVIFEVTDASHYHVPLLLNPYGYSTYRGS